LIIDGHFGNEEYNYGNNNYANYHNKFTIVAIMTEINYDMCTLQIMK